MKKNPLFRSVLSLTLAFAAFAAFAADAPIRIAFHGAGSDDLMQPAAKVRVSQSMFLTDLLGKETNFRMVSEQRTAAIYTVIKAGAIEFGTDDLYNIYNRYYPVDVVVDYYPVEAGDWKAGGYGLEIWTKDGGDKRVVKGDDMFKLSTELTEMLIKACKLGDEQAKRFRDHVAEKKKVYWALYVVPRLRGHYCDNTGETQMKALQGVMSSSKGDLRVAAKIVEAAWWGMADGRAIGLGSHDPNWTWAKVMRMGIAGLNDVIGTDYEDEMKNFVSHRKSPQSAEDTLYGYARILTEDAVSRAMSESLDTSSDEDDLDLDKDEKSAEDQGAKKEAQARGGLKGLAWRNSEKGLKLTLKCAAQKDKLTRRTVAFALGFYTNTAAVASTLAEYAADPDDVTAVYANRSLLRHQLAAPKAADAARRILDAKTAESGVIGLDPVVAALSVLADTGAPSDRARFTARVNDAKIARRVEAVRGIFAKCEPTAADLKLLDDTDHRVTVAGLHEIKAKQLRADRAFYDRIVAYANDPCSVVSDAARTPLFQTKPAGGPELVKFQLSLENPFVRRRIIDACVARKDVDGVAVGCANADAHVRAYALKALLALDRKRARAEALKLVTDPHTYSRFYASFVLAETAEKADLAVLEQALAKEKDRAAKLYFADAVALAAGKPKPAPQPKVNSATETGNAIVWQCGLEEPNADRKLYDGYYPCAEPTLKPSPAVIFAHDQRKASIFPRPTPIGNPGMIVTDAASADVFWTTLNKQMPDGCYQYVDGFVYGEETMGYNADAVWPKVWSTFCEDAGIDPDTVRGDRKKLTENQTLAWNDWGARVIVRGANEMIDFTRDYWGKLRPGIQCCTYDGNGCWGATDAYKDLKFDMYGTYIYDGDNRRMYEAVRRLKSIFPDKPVQWLSFGNVNVGLGSSSYGKPVTWNTPMPTHAITRRFEHCYADSMLVWLGGADTGYFTNYGTSSWDGKHKGSCLALGQIYHGSPVLDKAVDAAVADSRVKFKDLESASKRANKDEIDAPEDDDMDDLELEEEGGKEDPLMKKVNAQREAIRRGFLYMARQTHDTTAVLLGLKRQFPGHCDAFILGGEQCYTPAGMLLPRFDKFTTAEQPTSLPGLDHFKMAVVNGAKQRMDEATRVKWINWLREKPVILVINGGLFSTGVDWPYVDMKRPNGDLKTFWPWEKHVTLSEPVKAKGKTPAKPARLVIADGAPAKAALSDEFGVTRVVWRGKGFKGAVIFDLSKGQEATFKLQKLLRNFYAKNKVDIEINEHPGRIGGQVGTLQVEHLSWSSYTTNAVSRGFELLTGKYNPTVNPRFNCAVTTEEYVSPCLAIHGGVFITAHDAPLKVIEKLPNGLKVEVQGLCHVVTKNGPDAKIEGKDFKEIKTDPNLWFIDGVDDEGICTLPPHGDVECIKWGGAVDDMPAWRLFRVKSPTVLTITAK